MGDFTIQNLEDVEAREVSFGTARFARTALDAEQVGFTLHRFEPGQRQPFGHRHHQAEEVFVVLSGSGRVRLDDEVRELVTRDAVRIAPDVTRGFEAGDDGLELLVFGTHFDKDGELVHDWWVD